MSLQFENLVDVGKDDRWIKTVESLVAREDWHQLWLLALRTPPIWSVRILKFLNKRNWKPDPDNRLPMYEQLSAFAAKCNEYDLPTLELRQPKTMRLEDPPARIATARITADGEFLFVIDDKAAYLVIYRVDDIAEVSRVRLDMVGAKPHAILGFAVSPLGDRAAILIYDTVGRDAALNVFRFDEYGELKSTRSFKYPLENLGLQFPRLLLLPDAKSLYILTGVNRIFVWDLDRGAIVDQFENVASGPEFQCDAEYSPLAVTSTSSANDWRRFGRFSLSELAARGICFASKHRAAEVGSDYYAEPVDCIKGVSVLALQWGLFASIWDLPREIRKPKRMVPCSSGIFALSRDGKYAATINYSGLELADLTVEWTGSAREHEISTLRIVNSPMAPESAKRSALIEIAECADPAARVAFSEDSELLAVAMPHSDCIRLWHVPDGRQLGTLVGLAHEALVDFRFTMGGSLIAVTNAGAVQTWEADGNGNAWPWAPQLVQITHEPVDESSLQILRQAETMRRRGWLSVQECNLLDLALVLLQNRMNLDIEIDWHTDLPGDVFDIEID